MSDPKRTTQLTSFLMRQWWDAWEKGKGRRRTVDDIDNPQIKVAIREFVDKYLPELRREIQKGV